MSRVSQCLAQHTKWSILCYAGIMISRVSQCLAQHTKWSILCYAGIMISRVSQVLGSKSAHKVESCHTHFPVVHGSGLAAELPVISKSELVLSLPVANY
jgi:hypothetical protein